MKPGKDCIGVACGALILNDKKEVLLIKRTQASKFDAGFWTIIVGAVDYGEAMEVALKREAREEAGIEIEILRILRFVEIFPKNTGVHWVGNNYLCRHVGGVVKNMEPATHERVEWFALDKLPKPISPSTQETLDAYFKQEGIAV